MQTIERTIATRRSHRCQQKRKLWQRAISSSAHPDSIERLRLDWLDEVEAAAFVTEHAEQVEAA